MMQQNQPPMGYPPMPPPRRGRPWWVWLLVGCGGLSLLIAIGLGISIWYAYHLYQQTAAEVGPVNEATVTSALGGVPLYPGSKLEVDGTKAVLVAFRVAEKWHKGQPGSLVKGAAILTTTDASDKVTQYYDRELTARGYERATSSEKGDSLRVYTKKDEFVTVGITHRTAGDPTQISLARGGPMLLEIERQARNRVNVGVPTSAAPSPAPSSLASPSPGHPPVASSPAPASPAEESSPGEGDRSPSSSEDSSQ